MRESAHAVTTKTISFDLLLYQENFFETWNPNEPLSL